MGKKSPRPDCFSSEIYQNYQEILSIVFKLFHSLETEWSLSKSFYEAIVVLLPKSIKTPKRENDRLISLIRIDTNVLNKPLSSQMWDHNRGYLPGCLSMLKLINVISLETRLKDKKSVFLLDVENAVYELQHAIMINVLEKIVIQVEKFKIVKGISSKPAASFNLNGKYHKNITKIRDKTRFPPSTLIQ